MSTVTVDFFFEQSQVLWWYISRFMLLSVSDYSWDISTSTNQKWAHPFCNLIAPRCFSSICWSLKSLWNNSFDRLRIDPNLNVFQFQRKRRGYGAWWHSLSVCSGHPWNTTSCTASTGQTEEAEWGSTVPPVRPRDPGTFWHDHWSSLNLSPLSIQICEYHIFLKCNIVLWFLKLCVCHWIFYDPLHLPFHLNDWISLSW